jgi:hypothetical protein
MFRISVLLPCVATRLIYIAVKNVWVKLKLV